MSSEGVDVRLVIPAADGPAAPVSPGVPSSAVPPTRSQTDLPRTGAELLAVLLIAVVLLVLGALLVKAGHVRRRPV